MGFLEQQWQRQQIGEHSTTHKLQEQEEQQQEETRVVVAVAAAGNGEERERESLNLQGRIPCQQSYMMMDQRPYSHNGLLGATQPGCDV